MSLSVRSLAALALAGCVVAGPAVAQDAKLKLPVIKYETYTLPNGLKVITHEDHRLPLVAVDLWYHVGALNERPGRTGFAHLFEHMMFEGSEHVGEKAHFKYVEGAGATDINGTTNFDRTNYFETLPSNQIELGMWLESDRMGFLMEGLDRVKLANQRDVVRNEKRQGEGQPYRVMTDATFHLLFPKEHPYYGVVIGSHADVEAARIADVRDFHQQFYTPNNATIAIAGDFNPKQLKELLTKYFGPIPAGPKVEPVNVATPPVTSQRRATVTDTVKLPRLQISWLTPAAFAPDAASMDIAVDVLGDGKTSRLQQALIYKTQVAQSVACFSQTLKLTGITGCAVTAKPGVKLEDLEATVWSELGKLQQDGPTAQEVEGAKAKTLTETITGLQRLGGFGGVADTLDYYDQYTGDPGYLPKDIAATEAVTAASAKAAAVKYLTKDASVVVYCVPGKKVTEDVARSPENTDADVKIVNPYSAEFEASQNWRKTPPPAGPASTFLLPTPKMFALSNGMKVYFVEDKALPVLSASVAVLAGSENNPADKGGLASLTAAAMGEATTSRNVTKLAEDEDRIGTRIATGVGMDGSNATMTILSNHVNDGMDLLADVVQHPAFHEEDVDRLRKQRLVAFGQEGDSVSAIAARVAPKLVYGDQPYGRVSTGTTDSVQGLTRADLASFYGAHYGPKDSALILVGDVTEAEAKKVAEHSFGSWTSTAASGATLPPAPAMLPTHVVIVDKPGAPQSALSALTLGLPVGTPDREIVEVMDFTLGESFSSRINMNLREAHGYTYGAGTGFSFYRAGGLFRASTLVRTDVTGLAAKELMYELKRFPANPSTEAEVKEAKIASVKSLPGQFETTDATASALRNIFYYQRPLDYYAKLPARYEGVTVADVARVAKEDLHPDSMAILVVGDRTKIEPQLKEQNLGPIEIRDGQGNLVPSTK